MHARKSLPVALKNLVKIGREMGALSLTQAYKNKKAKPEVS